MTHLVLENKRCPDCPMGRLSTITSDSIIVGMIMNHSKKTEMVILTKYKCNVCGKVVYL